MSIKNGVSSNSDISKSADAQAKIQRIAYEHAMTLDEARIYFLRQLD